MAKKGNTILATHGLSVRRGSNQVLKCVDLKVQSGEIIGIVGINGSGKTTLLHALVGAIESDFDSFELLERPWHARALKDRARLVSLVPQGLELDFPFTVLDLVEMGRYPFASDVRPLSELDNAIVDDAIHAMALEALRHREFATLSGGEKQRTLIARALAQQSEVTLLDEPTAHLDWAQAASTVQALKNLTCHQRQSVGSVVIASHDLNLVHRLADRVYFLAQGTLLGGGSCREEMTESALAAVMGCPISTILAQDGEPFFMPGALSHR